MHKQITQLLIYAALFLGVVVTSYGLIDIGIVKKINTKLSSNIYQFGFVAILLIQFILFVEILRKKFQIDYLCIGLGIIALLSILTGTVWSLLVVLGFFLSSYVLGHYFLKMIKIFNTNILISILIGVVLYGSTISILVHFPINYPAIYGLAMLIPILLGRQLIADIPVITLKKTKTDKKFNLVSLAILSLVAMHCLVTLMPEVGHDALAMHLFIPHHVFYNHEWGFDVDKYVWATMPMLGDWVYTFVYMLGGESAARLINFSFILMLSYLVYDLVLWAKGNNKGAKWAALILLSSPLTLTESSTLFIESIWSVFVVAGVMVVMKLMLVNHTNNKNYLIVAAVLFGGALATKAVTLMVLPILLVLLIFYYKAWFLSIRMNALTFSIVIFLLIGGMPYLNAYIITDNPVLPFFNAFFQSAYYPAVNFSASAFFEKGVTWDTIYRVTFDSGKYLESAPGAGGFQWLLLLFPALILFTLTKNKRGLWLMVIALISITFVFQQTAYLRYIYPLYAILIASIGLFISIIMSSNYQQAIKMFVLAISTMVVFFNVLFIKSGTNYADINLSALASSEGKYRYLESRMPIRNAIDFVNKVNINKDPVAVFTSPLVAGLNANALHPNWYNYKFQKMILSTKNVTEVADVLARSKVSYMLLDDHWRFTEQVGLIKQATKEIYRTGSISVRAINDEYFLWKNELIKSTSFSNIKLWNLTRDIEATVAVPGTKAKTSYGVKVSVDYPVTQFVQIEPNTRYLLEVDSSCFNSLHATYRLQINWLDENSEYISTYIKVFNCTNNISKISRIVEAPNNAKLAVVYATGHTKTPVIINNISLRE